MAEVDTSRCCHGRGYHYWDCENNEFREENERELLKTAIGNLKAADAQARLAATAATAIRLLEAALHLHMNGERAPGGDETWAEWEHAVEEFLRSRLDVHVS